MDHPAVGGAGDVVRGATFWAFGRWRTSNWTFTREDVHSWVKALDVQFVHGWEP